MNVVELPDAPALWREVEGFLSADPANNTHQLSALQRILNLGTPRGERFFVVRDEVGGADHVVGSAVIVDTQTLFLAYMPDAVTEALARHLRERDVRLAGVVGRQDTLQAFTGVFGAASSVHVQLMLYRLERAPDFGHATGEARIATTAELPTLVQWHREFEAEVGMIPVPTPLEERVARRINDRQLMLWLDGGMPVSFAGFNSLPGNSARIGPVYTPVAARTRGYAQAVTAAASAHLQSDGPRTVFLFTDASNPVSNKVYQRIGFVFLSDHAHLLFEHTAS